MESHVVPGELRRYSVAAGPYLGAPWQDVPYLLDRLCEWLESMKPSDDADRIPTAFIKAVLAHVYIEWIHPFGNGNGRLGRLVEFLILVESGVPLPAAHVLTSHYNDTRTEYYRQLGEASRNGGDLRRFLLYAAQGLVDGLVEAIKQLHRQQEELMWRALVDEEFIDRHTPAAHRQRLVAIELGRVRGWVKRAELRRLTHGLMEAYYGKTSKTLTRDVNRLHELSLVQGVAGPQVRARLERVRGMRPFALGGEAASP
ncbi:MAG: Fic family protein [Acidimicrobiales bacterium]